MTPRQPPTTFIWALPKALRHVSFFLHTIWGFLESDFVTFAVPNTAFGMFGAYASSVLTSGGSVVPSTVEVLRRLPFVLAFNIGNLLIFDLANQRSPSSVAEDRLNKPWRPIPQGKITSNQTRRLILILLPAVLMMNYILGAWQQGVFILILTWSYNDLQGGDEAFIREIIIAIAYGLFNSGSLIVAVGAKTSLSALGIAWTAIVSSVILTTMQVQDLKDQAGDKLRGRRTIALFLGEKFSRVSIAFFVCFWSCVSAYFWTLGPIALCCIAVVATIVAVRVIFVNSQKGDARTWRLWCLWHASLYTLPVVMLRRTYEELDLLSFEA
ncbi:UbiA prenyltransferase family-domain-containing protein [Annulohypoxylon nitens]|nr:UbiA prenyltransferase family-domain-containing protein [Annulohypoxylon nitens]